MSLFLSSLLLAGAAMGAPAEYCPTPVQPAVASPTPLQPGMVTNCNKFHKVTTGENCNTIAKNVSISFDDFRAYNTLIDEKCTNLLLDYYACVSVNGTATPPKTPPGRIVEPPAPTPSPLQAGVVGNCNKFYEVQGGEDCNKVAGYFNITFADLRTYNTGIDDKCSNLAAGSYACVSVDGPIPASPPAKYQPGAVENCITYYTVTNGQDCNTVAQKNNITFADLRRFNTGIDETCTNLVAGADACVSTTGTTPATPPVRYQPGFVDNCKTSVTVPSGSTCDGFAKDNKITFADLRRLNTGIDENCSNLAAGALACVAA